MQERSLSSTPSPAFIVYRFFNEGHSDHCEVISHCTFDLHFSNNERSWASFHVLGSHLYVFEKRSKSFSHFLIGLFVFLALSCMSCLYTLEINPLSGFLCFKLILYFICYYFLPFWGLSFNLAYSFLCCAKAFQFNQVPFVYFWFYFCYSRRWVIQDLALIYVIKYSACVLLKSFIVSGLTFRSLIHFQFIFVFGVRTCSNFIPLHVAVQFSQHHLLKRLSLPHCIFLPPLSKIRYPEVHGFISGLSILFHWSVFLFLYQYHTVLMTIAL